MTKGTGKNPEKESEYLKVVERNGRRLLALINDILDLSKIESGRMDIFASTFSPASVIDDVVASMTPLADRKGLHISVDTGNCRDMVTDRDKVHQIILNLVSNAIKFTDAGTVTIGITEENGTTTFTVKDTGIGMNPDDLTTIFDQFRQIDGSTTRRHEGTGLGLAICRKLAHLLGGDLLVQSEPEKGSTFTLRLPRATTGQLPPAAPLPAAPASAPEERPEADTVLVVDDNSDVRRAISSVLVVEDNDIAAMQISLVLEELGCRVHHAADGGEAISLVSKTIPDLIIMDLMMPGIDGFEVLESIRSRPETLLVPVVVLTAKELTAADRSRLSNNNIRQLIRKGSLDRDQLKRIVVDALSAGPAPLVPAAPSPERESTPSRSLASLEGRILVVEDNEDNRTTLKAVLHDFRGELKIAVDGESAVELAKTFKPDLVLMDIQLPGMCGIEATRRIRDGAERNIPVVALTARAMASQRNELDNAGFNDIITKPYDPDRLRNLVAGYLAK